jgi:hypothetical protein
VQIAYITTDEANEDLALQMADECGITLRPMFPPDAVNDSCCDAILYDWDALSAQERKEITFDCLAGYACCPVAVHGYVLNNAERQALHNDGIAVFRCLDLQVFKTLRRLVRRNSRVFQTA